MLRQIKPISPLTESVKNNERRIDYGNSKIFAGVSYNELHALMLGLSLGFMAGRSGSAKSAISLMKKAIAGSDSGQIGQLTIETEPWYFCTGISAGYYVGKWL